MSEPFDIPNDEYTKFYEPLWARRKAAEKMVNYYVHRFEQIVGNDYYIDRRGDPNRVYESFKSDIEGWEEARAKCKAAEMLLTIARDGMSVGRKASMRLMHDVIHVLSFGDDIRTMKKHCTVKQIAYCHDVANRVEKQIGYMDRVITRELAKAKAYKRPVGMTRRSFGYHILPAVGGGLLVGTAFSLVKPEDAPEPAARVKPSVADVASAGPLEERKKGGINMPSMSELGQHARHLAGYVEAAAGGGALGVVLEELKHGYDVPRMSLSALTQLAQHLQRFEGTMKLVRGFGEELAAQR